jgi:hypothetical protein
MRMNVGAVAVLLLLAHSTWCPLASAQGLASSLVIQQADSAFVRGRALFEQGRLKEAAREFELSSRLDPSPGTLLNLAACHEGLGDLALALSTFERAATAAKQTRDPRRRRLWIDAARQRIEDLLERVPILMLRGVQPGSSVMLDGSSIDARGVDASGMDAGGLVRRVNPGRHVLRVSALGKRSMTRAFSIEEGARSTIALPSLEPSLAPPDMQARPAIGAGAVESSVSAPSEPTRAVGVWPLVLGGTGGALLLSGAVTGWLATSKHDELRRACPGDDCPESKALEATRDSGRALARAADVLLIAGAVCTGVGATLFVLGAGDGEPPGRTGSNLRATAALRAGCFGDHCGVLASGRF